LREFAKTLNRKCEGLIGTNNLELEVLGVRTYLGAEELYVKLLGLFGTQNPS